MTRPATITRTDEKDLTGKMCHLDLEMRVRQLAQAEVKFRLSTDEDGTLT